MVELTDLWLPILVSAAIVFVASFVLWALSPHHRADMGFLKDEGPVLRALEETNARPGMYYVPGCADKERMKSEEMKQQWKRGPWAFLILPGSAPSFARNLVICFVEFLLVSVFVAYLGTLVFGEGAEYMKVFRVTGAAAVLAYVFGSIGHDAFQMKPLRYTLFCMIDGVIYALLTAGTFAWLWPAAPKPY